MIILHIIKVVVEILVILFIITFGVYFFNLDMKLTASLEPLFAKHYDKINRDNHL